MKSILKFTAAVVVFSTVLVLSSCHRQTCPTYTQSDVQSIEKVRA